MQTHTSTATNLDLIVAVLDSAVHFGS